MATSSSTISASSRIQNLAVALNMPPLLAFLLNYIISWRTVALVLALLNLKSLPFAWHARLFALMVKHGRPIRKIQNFLRANPSTKLPKGISDVANLDGDKNEALHPIFRPVTIQSRTSLYETDYNLHKSNSTYFADLDHSRTALVASLLTPALAHSTLSKHGEKRGALFPILGSVHTSFLREIKPLQAYSIRSRLLGWDRKWLVIASYFVRPATKAEKSKARKEQKPEPKEVLLACSLNKYVVKKGRKTIDPGLALAASGWFRAREGITHNIPVTTAAVSSPSTGNTTTDKQTDVLGESTVVVPPQSQSQSQLQSSTGTGTITSATSTEQAQGHSISSTSTSSATDLDSTSNSGQDTPNPLPTPSQTSIRTAETVSKVVRRLSSAALDSSLSPLSSLSSSLTPAASSADDTDGDDEADVEIGGYTWTNINRQRLEGMKIVENWMGLDGELRVEYERALLEGRVIPYS